MLVEQGKKIGAVQSIRTDEHGAFQAEFQTHLDDRGIKHEKTVRYEHEAAGFIERMNRTIGERARAQMVEGDVPMPLEGYSFLHSAAITNRVFTTTEGTTPFEKRYKTQPDMSHFRIFFSPAVITLPPELQRKSSPEHGIRCRYLGRSPDHKADIFIEVATHRIITASAATFFEDWKTNRTIDMSKYILNFDELFDTDSDYNGENDDLLSSGVPVPRIGDDNNLGAKPNAVSRTVAGPSTSDLGVGDLSLDKSEFSTTRSITTSDVLQPAAKLSGKRTSTKKIYHPPPSSISHNTKKIPLKSGQYRHPLKGVVEFEPSTAPAKRDITGPPTHSSRRSPPSNISIYNKNVHRVMVPNEIGAQAAVNHVFTPASTTDDTNAAWWGKAEDDDENYDFDSYHAFTASMSSDVPSSLKAAQKHPEWPEYRQAMFVELSALHVNQTWKTMPRSSYLKRNTIKSKWVFTKKYNHDGTLNKYKARLVAKGFTQRHGVDYQETFAPTMALKSFRTLVATATSELKTLFHADVPTAFIRSTLTEESVLLEPPEIPGDLVLPEGFSKCSPDELYLLLKALYGLKQAPRQWYSTMRDYLNSLGFTQAASDPCIFVLDKNDEHMTIGLYVDDLLYFGDQGLIDSVMLSLQDKFNITLLGPATHFLGIHIDQINPGLTTLDQNTYIDGFLDTFKSLLTTPVSTPLLPNYSAVLREGVNLPDHFPSQFTYNEVLGKLMYAMVGTRPDICAAVGIASRFLKDPKTVHWALLIRILNYLNYRPSKGIKYQADPLKTLAENMVPEVWTDADFANDPEQARSISGFGIMLCSGPVVWYSKKQSTTAQSTAEAEYISANICTRTVVWLRNLLWDLGFRQQKPTIIHEDNQSRIAISTNPQLNEKTAHIQVKYHYIQEKIQDKTILLQYCPTLDHLADMFTKGLARLQFDRLLKLFGVVNLGGMLR